MIIVQLSSGPVLARCNPLLVIPCQGITYKSCVPLCSVVAVVLIVLLVVKLDCGEWVVLLLVELDYSE